MTVRAATADDVEVIKQVARRSWETDYPDILTRETVEAGIGDWYALDSLTTALARERTSLLVAEPESSVVGFVHAVRQAATGVGFVLRLYVDPDHRREGVGAALLDAVAEALSGDGLERIDAAVLSANGLGRTFYESFGFELADEAETRIGGESYPECRYSLSADALVGYT
ncbi:MAG: ribosomal protein S18 acetylase RimI-like enzyme [Salinirussus sp.]|jgi:ribosomal protein S18 acetylase RimI-like enzyme